MVAVIYFRRAVIKQPAFNAVIDNPGAAAGGVKSNRRSGFINDIVDKNGIIAFAAPAVFRIIAGNRAKPSAGGKRHVRIGINGTAQSQTVSGSGLSAVVDKAAENAADGCIVIVEKGPALSFRPAVAFGKNAVRNKIAANIADDGSVVIVNGAAVNRCRIEPNCR